MTRRENQKKQWESLINNPVAHKSISSSSSSNMSITFPKAEESFIAHAKPCLPHVSSRSQFMSVISFINDFIAISAF